MTGDPDVMEATVIVQGLHIRILAAGEAVPPILLLHGGGLDSASLSWRLTIAPLAAAGHRVYAPDLPGYGASDKPRMRYTLRFYTDLVAPLLDALGLERTSLVGISMGGAISLGFALDHPQRVERLVLVDSHGLGGHIPYGALGYLLVHLPWLNELSWKWLARDRAMVRKSLEQFVASAGTITEDLVDEVFQMVKEPGVGTAWRSLQKNEICWLHARTNYVSRLGEVRAPTLIIHGAGDKLVPLAWAERAQQLIPNAQLAVLPATRHWPPREQPEAFNRLLIDFLLARGVPNKFGTSSSDQARPAHST